MKRFRNIALALVVISFFLVVAVCTFYNINMAKVSNDNTLKEVTIKAGSINSIANTLKENNLSVITDIADISARLIVNKSSYRFKNIKITEMVDKIKEAIKW